MVYSKTPKGSGLHYVDGKMIDVCRSQKDLTRNGCSLSEVLSLHLSEGLRKATE
jgi:hypothetical protein